MTYTLKSETIDGYTVSIEQEKFCKCFMVYIFTPYGTTYRRSNPQPDLTRAKATYRRYRKEVMELTAWIEKGV